MGYDHRGKEFVLARVVIVDAAGGDTSFLGNGAHRRSVEALLDELLVGRVQQGLAGAFAFGDWVIG